MRTLLLLTVSLIGFYCYPQESSMEGLASYYASKFEGRLTANGEIFSNDSLTAAHRTLPFGTIVKVTNPSNKLSVIVRINDRGPFIEGRIIDLSQAAAKELKFIQEGICEVELEIITQQVEANQLSD